MNDRPSIEITADTVDDAIARGLSTLGVGPGDVIVEVLDEPTRGVFGIGARPAKVRLQLLRRPAPPPAPEPVIERETSAPEKPQAARSPEREVNRADRNRDDRRPKHRSDDNRDRQPRSTSDEYEYNEEEEAYAFSETPGDAAGEDGEVSKTVLLELLKNMGVKATVAITRGAASQPEENPPWLLNVEGRDINSLIGRRGETLSSLQYITRLIASRLIGRRANIVVDVGEYKLRRSQKLRELALRMADQAVREARTVVLEPMPPHERRMIHMALRQRTDVSTKSTGEGEARKVTIIPDGSS
ncbi:MAG: Jag N-terminal domain-containing protein [Anaerolineae bacterium]|nr:Jag N-terminal domain-containing protein [Anaerolineae bacterium]